MYKFSDDRYPFLVCTSRYGGPVECRILLPRKLPVGFLVDFPVGIVFKFSALPAGGHRQVCEEEGRQPDAGRAALLLRGLQQLLHDDSGRRPGPPQGGANVKVAGLDSNVGEPLNVRATLITLNI